MKFKNSDNCTYETLQTRTKLRKSPNSILNFATYKLRLRVKTNHQILFVLKIVFTKNLQLVQFTNFRMGSTINPIMMNA